jgi:hypothetical protein
VSDHKLIEACSALHPGGTVVAAGAFQPRGTQGLLMLGPAGVLGGRMLSQSEDVPRYAIVAVTEQEILMFRAESFHAGWKPVELVGSYPRATTQVMRTPGVLVRKLTIEPEGGAPIALESPRIGAWHGAGVNAALGAQ